MSEKESVSDRLFRSTRVRLQVKKVEKSNPILN
jgi:hypothetical protein